MKKSVKKVFVAMSGGVDSSVAAVLLKARGFAVVGVHMKCFNVDGCAEGDAEDARRAAEVLGIPFYVFDFEREYKDKVVSYMIEGYRKGLTPNPDVMCNKEIKFGLFLKKALEMGADYIATGHYVRLGTRDKGQRTRNNKSMSHAPCQMSLSISKDTNKDQSYFLWTLTQEQLKHCLFPIGNYLKSEVRELARKFGLPNSEKKDSQGICFLGKITLRDFLGNYIRPRAGSVILTPPTAGEGSQRIIGEHQGAEFYTIGQRHIGLATSHWPIATSNRKSLYVAEKDIKTNTLVVAEGSDNPALYKMEIELRDVNFIDKRQATRDRRQEVEIFVRIRYRQPLAKAKLIIQHQSVSKSASVRLLFEQAQKAVAPGQSAVLYSESGELLGGGVIRG